MFDWIGRSVGRQITTITVAVLAVVSLAAGWYNVESQRGVLIEGMERQARLLARTTAILAVEPLLERDWPTLSTFVEELTAREDRAIYARIERRDGKVVAEAGSATAADPEEIREYSAMVYAPRIGGAAEVPPVLGRTVVGFSTAEAEHRIRYAHATYLLQALATFALLVVVLGWILQRLVIRPLRLLASQAQGLGAGDFDKEIHLDQGDEFGDLARTLEDMRGRLVTSYREIQEQNARLREVDQLKSSFLATMSHEIRTPMNGILGFADLLQETDLDADQRMMIKTVVTSTEALLAIINDILDLSKIEAGQVQLDIVDFDLGDVVAEVAHLLRPEAAKKGLEFETEVDPDLPSTLVGDPLRIRQVVTNLVANAIKFTEQGHVALRVKLREHSPASVAVHLSVEDTGIGLDEETRSKLFRAFTQADASTTRKYGGTGLGLAISRCLISLMGGEIGVDSEPGRGSTFWVSLVLRKAAEAETEAGTPSSPAVGDARVLVLGRDRSSERSVQLLLDSWNVETLSADSAQAALDHVREASRAGRPFHLALLDADRVGDGDRSLVASLRAACPGDTLPVILMVAPGRRLRDWDRLGVQAVLHEPLSAHGLFEALEDVLRHGRLGRDPAASGSGPPGKAGPSAGRILLVEDDLTNQRLALHILVKVGYTVDIANDGREAVHAVERSDEPYDVVLMDCQMPVMDGYAATRAIRGLPGAASRTPIVAMTAHAMKGDREECLAAGMDDYITKPVNPAALRGLVAAWVERGAPVAT